MPPNAPKKPPILRRKYILESIASKGINEIAADCGVNESTIDRDIANLKESGEWYTWIEYELIRLHKSRDIDDVVKYKEMAKLYSKSMVEKHEVETKGTQTIEVVYSEDMKSARDKLSTPPSADTVP